METETRRKGEDEEIREGRGWRGREEVGEDGSTPWARTNQATRREWGTRGQEE